MFKSSTYIALTYRNKIKMNFIKCIDQHTHNDKYFVFGGGDEWAELSWADYKDEMRRLNEFLFKFNSNSIQDDYFNSIHNNKIQ
jgi:hypothetical protein